MNNRIKPKDLAEVEAALEQGKRVMISNFSGNGFYQIGKMSWYDGQRQFQDVGGRNFPVSESMHRIEIWE